MRDRLLINTPRLAEGEPGHVVNGLMADFDLDDVQSYWDSIVGYYENATGTHAAFVDKHAGVIMGRPMPLQSTDEPGDWIATILGDINLQAVDIPGAGGKGVMLADLTDPMGVEGVPQLTRTGKVLGTNQGFLVSFLCYEPEPTADVNQGWLFDNLEIAWGDPLPRGSNPPNMAIPMWSLKFTPSVDGPGKAAVYRNKDWNFRIDDTPDEPQGQRIQRTALVTGELLTGPFYGKRHRLWIQPLSPTRFKIYNWEDLSKALLVTVDEPYEYLPDDLPYTPDNYPPAYAHAPWGPHNLVVWCPTRAWFIVQEVAFPVRWSVHMRDQDHGYKCSQPVDVTGRVFYPDGIDEGAFSGYGLPDVGSNYRATLSVYAGPYTEPGSIEWNQNGRPPMSSYAWALLCESPMDIIEDSRLSLRTVVIDAMQLQWPRTVGSDMAVEVDLFDQYRTGLAGDGHQLGWSRSSWDADSQFSATIYGPASILSPIIRTNARALYQIDLNDGVGPTDYWCAFDGVIDDPTMSEFTVKDVSNVPGATDPWVMTGPLRLRTRWLLAAECLYRSTEALDGLNRSDAYVALLRTLPLDDSEITIGALKLDEPLPAATQGKPAVWSAQLGTPLSDLLKGLWESAGKGERLQFADIGNGAQFVIDVPSKQPVATFYRDEYTAAAFGHPERLIGGPDKDGALVLTRSGSGAYNEILVVGQNLDVNEATALAGGPIDEAARGDLVCARWADERSWQDKTYARFYLGVRKTLIVVDPTATTQGAAEERVKELALRFGRYQLAGRFTSRYVVGIRPGDLVTVNAGTTGGGDATLEVCGMSVRLWAREAPLAYRYLCEYEVREAPQ